jgi:hypothetical protein
MNRTLIVTAALALALGGCAGDTEPTEQPTPEPTPDATATLEPTAETKPTAEPTASATQTVDGRFIPAENAAADALFLGRDECQNLRDGYQLIYPDDWYTNTEFRDLAPCSWFSPTFYEVDDSGEVPDEIAITIEWISSDFGFFEDPIRHEFEGPNLVARTTRDMGGDYELNKAVLDRLMLTIEFIGSVQ